MVDIVNSICLAKTILTLCRTTLCCPAFLEFLQRIMPDLVEWILV